MNLIQPDLFAPEKRQPAPLPQVEIKPGSSTWPWQDRLRHLEATNCAASLSMVGPHLEVQARQRLAELDAKEADRRAGNDTRRY